MSGDGRLAGRLFVGLVLLTAFHDLAGRNLHDIDTSRWGTLAREMVRSNEWIVPTRYGEVYADKPPLYLWAVAIPSKLTGEVTPFWVRLPSALGFILLVLMSAWWVRMRTGSEEAGRLAGLLLLSTFGMAWLAREGRLDMMGAGLAIAGTVLLDRAALGLGGRRTPWLAGAFLGLALLVKGPPLLLVPIAVLLVPSAGRTLRERLGAARPHVVLATAVVVALLWFVPAVLEGGWSYGRGLLFKQAADRFTGAALGVQPWWYYLVGTPLAAAPWGVFYVLACVGAWFPRGRRAFGPVAGIALAASIVTLVFTLIPTKHFRYLTPVVPLSAVPCAWWLAARLQIAPTARWRRQLRHAAIATGLGGLGVVIAGGFPDGAFLPALVPGAALLAVAVAAWRLAATPDADARTQRRGVVVCVLYAAVLGLLAFNVLRPRFHDSPNEIFNARLAELIAPGIPVYVGDGMSPESVFHGAPDAHYPYDFTKPVPVPADQPVIVVCTNRAIPALLAANPRAGKVLLSVGGRYQYAIVGFGLP